MKIRDLLELNADNWNSPPGPVGQDWYEAYIGMGFPSRLHPPSLNNPQKVEVPTARDGWEPGASKEAREKAKADLGEIHRRLLRQIGRPSVARTADYPLYPSTAKNL